MEYPFRVSGRTVEVYRYRVDYTEDRPKEGGEMVQEAVTAYCPTQEGALAVAEQTGGQITALDASAYEWMDGLEVADVPDTYAAAVKIYQMGEAEYRRWVAFEEKKRADQLRADLDYVMLMGGL